MLQQIIQDMYIDPDLLAELSEEQQQILYFKMREEQIRRYDVWSTADDKKSEVGSRKSSGSKGLQWQNDSTGKVWVWVMGHHRNDKSYEQLLEESRLRQVQKQAEEEMRAHRELLELREKQVQEEEEAKQKKLWEEEQRLALVKKELEEKRRKAEEAAIYATLKEAKLAKLQEEKLEQERRAADKKEKELKEREKILQADKIRRANETTKRKVEYRRKVSQKSEDLYMTVSKVAAEQMRMVEKEKEKVENTWQVTLRKIKLADKQRAMIARRAREEVRNSRMSLDIDALTLDDMLKKSAKNETKTRSSKPKRPASKNDVLKWYRLTEIPKMAGIIRSTKKPEQWFHGCISRPQAATLLHNKPHGSFLIRLSEKVWGYVLSYKDTDIVKHFLIDASGSNYQFFGTDQLIHKSLSDMVKHHKERPITFSGQEILTEPCGQNAGIPDYQDLF